MNETDQGLADMADALVLVRGLWNQKDVPERAVPWAMMIEAVGRLAALRGSARMGRMLEGLLQEVQGRSASPVPR